MRYGYIQPILFITILLIVLVTMCIKCILQSKHFSGTNGGPQFGYSDDNYYEFDPPEPMMLDSRNYVTAVYYSNWSPYSPRHHFPHDIDLEKVSHVYYAFFEIDPRTGHLNSSDEWSDFQIDTQTGTMQHPNSSVTIAEGPPGCVGELFRLKLKYGFKMILSIGGWSNRRAFPEIVRNADKFEVLVASSVETMFKYGFDGIDLDWEFPRDDGVEPLKYLKLTRDIRMRMDKLEEDIFGGRSERRFQLSVAAPAFEEKLKILPVKEMDHFLDYWNMMTYDYYGDWSAATGYHCNLYDGSARLNFTAQYKHSPTKHHSEPGLNGHAAISLMIDKFGVNSTKLVLGMVAYGRGFTNVKLDKGDTIFVNKPFKGVGGGIDGEPGMWLYKQLPLNGTEEQFDPHYVAAFCYDPRTNTFIGYDNVQSVQIKARYIRNRKLAGGFWWESCGEAYGDEKRSLLNAFAQEVGISKESLEIDTYEDQKVISYYAKHFPEDKYLLPYLKAHR